MARVVGKENVPAARKQALEYLNDIIDEMNTYIPWESMRFVTSDTAFTADTSEYTLDSDVYRVEKVQVVDATTGAVQWTVTYMDPMQYKDWDEFEARAVASVYFLRSIYRDNKITFKGTPDSGLAAGQKWRAQIVKRIPQLNNEGEIPDIAREFQRPILEGAKWLMRDNSPTTDKADTLASFNHYQRLIKRIANAERNHPDHRPRWRLNQGIQTSAPPFFRINF